MEIREVLIKRIRDAGQRFSDSVKIQKGSLSVEISIDSDNASWNMAGINVTLQTQISQDGITWRDYHAIHIDTRKGIPSARPQLMFDVDERVGWFLRVKLVTNKRMNIGVNIEVT